VAEDRGLGLDHLELARDEDLAEQVEEGVGRVAADERERLAGPVRDRVERHVPRGQTLEQRHRARDRAADHLDPAGVVGLDARALVGVRRDQLGHRLAERLAGVERRGSRRRW
jgi:hypothetical protein